MKNQKRVISKRRPHAVFVEPETTISCTQKVQKAILTNLRKAAYSRVDPVRAGRCRQLLEQVETRPAAADRRERIKPLAAAAAAAPAPTSAPMAQAERAAPHRDQQHRWPTHASVKRCFSTVRGWFRKAWTGGLAGG